MIITSQGIYNHKVKQNEIFWQVSRSEIKIKTIQNLRKKFIDLKTPFAPLDIIKISVQKIKIVKESAAM